MPELTQIEGVEFVPISSDCYTLQLSFVVTYEYTVQDNGDETSPKKIFSEQTPNSPNLSWPLKGDATWRIVVRADIREWLERTIGPYSPDGLYGASKLRADAVAFEDVALHFKNHRDAIAFKMTWM